MTVKTDKPVALNLNYKLSHSVLIYASSSLSGS